MNYQILVALLACAAPVPKMNLTTPVVRITLLASSIQSGDPVFFAATLENHSAEYLLFKRKRSIWSDAVSYELKVPGGHSYQDVQILDQQISTSDAASVVEYRLPSGKVDRQHLCLSTFESLTLESGTYSLKIRVFHRDGEIISDPVEFKVGVRSERSSKSLDSLTPLSYSLPTTPAYSTQVILFQKAVDDLQGSSVGTIIRNRLLASEVAFSSPKDFVKVLERIDTRRKDLSDFEKEILDLAVCSALLSRQNVKEAETVIKRIQEPSVELERLQRKLAEMKTYVK